MSDLTASIEADLLDVAKATRRRIGKQFRSIFRRKLDERLRFVPVDYVFPQPAGPLAILKSPACGLNIDAGKAANASASGL